jgi:hypothetical protein
METYIAGSDSCSCVADFICYMQRTEQPKFQISYLPVLDNDRDFSVIETNTQKESANK